MRAFLIVWFGQVISMLGSSMTAFALTIWAYEITGSATALALVSFFSFGPAIIFSPVAGALVDRWNRKLVMMLSDLGAGAATIAVLILYSTGNLQIWHLYVAGAVSGIFATFQWPAYSAAISTMLPKDQYARASGLLGLADSISNVFAPVFATALLVIIGISGVMIIDIVTFVFAVSTLVWIFVPQPEISASGAEGKGNLLKESIYGFRYILRRPSLLALQLTFLVVNLTGGFTFALVAPMLLARTGNNEAALATVQSLGAIGGIVGGLLLTTWGGPKRRIHGVLLGMIGASLLGHMLMGVGQVLGIWAIASFARAFFLPILNGSNQAIWQAKVAPDVQGRVFSARRMIAQITGPLSILVAGPLADRIFEPAMQTGGSLAPIFGGLVGTGTGAGMGLMFLIAGVVSLVVGLAGYALPVIRNAEDLLPDHEALVPSLATEAAPLAEDTTYVQTLGPHLNGNGYVHQLITEDESLLDDETISSSPTTLITPITTPIETQGTLPDARFVALSDESNVQSLLRELANNGLFVQSIAAENGQHEDETVVSPGIAAAQSVIVSDETHTQTLVSEVTDEALVYQEVAAEDWFPEEETVARFPMKPAVQSAALSEVEAQFQALIPRLAEGGVVRQRVIEELRAADPDISPLILSHVDNQNALIRAGCATVLGAYPSEHAVRVLIDLLQDQDVRPRLNAARSLGEIGDRRAVPALLRAIEDRSDLVRRAAIMSLGEIKDESVLAVLLDRLYTEENGLIKQSIIYALGELRSPEAAGPLLDVFLQPQESEKMRASAALVLTLLGDEGTGALHIALLQGDEFARESAKTYLHL